MTSKLGQKGCFLIEMEAKIKGLRNSARKRRHNRSSISRNCDLKKLYVTADEMNRCEKAEKRMKFEENMLEIDKIRRQGEGEYQKFGEVRFIV